MTSWQQVTSSFKIISLNYTFLDITLEFNEINLNPHIHIIFTLLEKNQLPVVVTIAIDVKIKKCILTRKKLISFLIFTNHFDFYFTGVNAWGGRHNGTLGQNVYAQILMNAIIVFKSSHTHTPHQMPTRYCVKNGISSGACQALFFRTKRFVLNEMLWNLLV